MNSIKVSVITIVKDDNVNIANTLYSVLQQTYSNFEYIIKDGLSEDGTRKIIQDVINNFPEQKIKYVSCYDKGIYDAMNQAVSYCEGEWIIFINSGDLFYNKMTLSRIFDCKREYQEFGVICGDAIVRDESGDVVWKSDLSKIEKKMPFCHQSCFVRKELLLKFPFDNSYKIAADYNLILDIYKQGILFCEVQEIVAIFMLQGISSTNYVVRYKERCRVLCSHAYQYKRIEVYMELLVQYIKMAMDRIVPKKLLLLLKKWYKKYIKKYISIE